MQVRGRLRYNEGTSCGLWRERRVSGHQQASKQVA
jgi:hypothetical protein